MNNMEALYNGFTKTRLVETLMDRDKKLAELFGKLSDADDNIKKLRSLVVEAKEIDAEAVFHSSSILSSKWHAKAKILLETNTV